MIASASGGQTEFPQQETCTSLAKGCQRGSGLWQTGGMVDREIQTPGGDVFGYLSPAVVGQSYVIRVRAVAPGGAS